jgi:hypothetical protein
VTSYYFITLLSTGEQRRLFWRSRNSLHTKFGARFGARLSMSAEGNYARPKAMWR